MNLSKKGLIWLSESVFEQVLYLEKGAVFKSSIFQKFNRTGEHLFLLPQATSS